MSQPIYFHQLTNWQRKKLESRGTTWAEAAARYLPPRWCEYPDPIEPLGCWSLVAGMIKGESNCRGCDCHRPSRAGRQT